MPAGHANRRLAVRAAVGAVLAGAVLTSPATAARAPECGPGHAADGVVGRPTRSLAWRAVLLDRAPVRDAPAKRARRSVSPRDAWALLVLGVARDDRGRCWLKVRLPSRPNHDKGWVNADRVELRLTPWRLLVSRSARRLKVLRAGHVVRRISVVVGAPGTPTPGGLFSIVQSWRWNPGDFLGSWILPLTAHSNVLQEFGGGDGRVGIHGRGGASLSDPLGTAASHGCIRLANHDIEWLVRRLGANDLPGTPLQVT